MTMDAPPFPTASKCCLFLDVDGTLLPLAPTPGEVVVDASLRDLLRILESHCDGALALISGRPIADLDSLFDPLALTAAGVHGCERRDTQGRWLKPHFDTEAFAGYRARLMRELEPLHGLLIEDKEFALAIHYRLVPHLESQLRNALDRLQSELPGQYERIDGDEVIEVKPASHDKGTAIEAFLQEAPFAGRYPIFIGDDLTDQDGFATIRRHHGLAIAVGSNVNAEWHLPGPADVRHWLTGLLTARAS
jgi:trehalose 6-phosphate phosphatase